MTAAHSVSTLDILLRYVSWGWPVFPVYGIRDKVCMCKAGAKCKGGAGKHPITTHGFKDASIDPVVVQAWYAKYPGCNWAIATGCALPDGGYLVVVDIDPRNGGDEALNRLETEHGDMPLTVTAMSGGNGVHYLYRALTALGGGKPADGVDFKGTGGYVVASPSLHHSGGIYRWYDRRGPEDIAIADLPLWLAAMVSGASRQRPETTGEDASDTMLGIAFRTAGMLGDALPEGRRAVVCPWAETHSDGRGRGRDSSTAVLPASLRTNHGGFKCLHSHCSEKTWKNAFDALPAYARDAARAATRVRSVSPSDSDSDPQSVSGVRARVPNWKDTLIRDTKGNLLEVAANVITVLKHHENWKGKIRYDEFAEAFRSFDVKWADDDAPMKLSNEWSDDDDVRLQAWFARQQEPLDVGVSTIRNAVGVVAKANAYHDVRDYLSGLVWDGKPRLQRFFSEYFSAEDSEYIRAVGSRWLISAVARVFEPGCQADCAPILEGRTGDGKSTGLEALVGGVWFSDSAIVIGSKDGYDGLRGKWVIELGELESLRGKSLGAIKQYISARSDHYRASYGHRHQTHPRQCVFAGTTNEDEYFTDTTGNRRFWPISCGVADVERIRRDRDQIWAEAVVQYRAGIKWHIDTPDVRALCEAEQHHRRHVDSWLQPVEQWLKTQNAVSGVTTFDVLTQAMLIDAGKINRAAETRVGIILRELGWNHVKQMTDFKGKIRRYYPAQSG